MRPESQIVSEIEKLQTIKTRIRKTSFFGDNHHDAIDFQVEVLEGIYDRDEIDNLADAGEVTDNVRDAGIEAIDWLDEENDQEAPSVSWKELLVKP